MKITAMKRILTFALSVLLLISLGQFLIEFQNRKKEREDILSTISDLNQSLSDYQEAEKALENCGIDYEQVLSEMSTLTEQHADAASDHRTELSQYTAEKSGYMQGAAALWEAKAAMPDAWATFMVAKDAFYEKYNAFYQGKAELEQYSWLFENIDAVQSLLNAALGSADGLSAQIQAADEWISSADNLDAAAEAVNAQLDPIRSALIQMIDSVNQLPDEQKNIVIQSVQGVTGMSLDEMAAALNSLDGITADDIRTGYMNMENALASGSASVSEQIQALQAKVTELNETYQTMLASEPMLISGKEAIDAAEQQLIEGEGTIQSSLEEIWYQLGQLDIEKSELEDEKATLEKEAEHLAELKAQADEYDALRTEAENRKSKLLANGTVQQYAENGMTMEKAVEQVCAEMVAEDTASGLSAKKTLGFLGAALISGIAAVIMSIKQKSSFYALFTSALLCCVCSAIVCILQKQTGDGTPVVEICISVISALLSLNILYMKIKDSV